MTTERYSIGDFVQVFAETQKVFSQLPDQKKGIKDWVPISLPASRIGVVVGACYRMSGEVHPGGMSYSFDGLVDCDQGHLSISKSHKLYQVRYGLLNKPVLAEECNLKLTSPVVLPRLAKVKEPLK